MAYMQDRRAKSPLSEDFDAKFFEKRQALRNQTLKRPQSEKFDTGKAVKKKANRIMQKPVGEKKDLPFLARLKPGKIPMDKERLYEENMTLKMQVNDMKEDVMKLRTKLNLIERQNAKNTEEEFKKTDRFAASHKNLHLVSSLKQNIRELKAELQSKDEQIQEMKKNIKTCLLYTSPSPRDS